METYGGKQRKKGFLGLFHSLPLQLCADQSSVSLPGSGPEKMVLIFAPVIVLVWNWALTRGHQAPFGELLLDTWSLLLSALLSGRILL